MFLLACLPTYLLCVGLKECICASCYSGPEVLFKTCVTMKFVDDDDDALITVNHQCSHIHVGLLPSLSIILIVNCYAKLFLLLWAIVCRRLSVFRLSAFLHPCVRDHAVIIF